MLSRPNHDPTESGPTEVRSRCARQIEPPPKAMLCTSGIVKFVLTPAILTKAEDCLGYPLFSNAHMSVVVLQHYVSLFLAGYTRSPTLQRQRQGLRLHQLHKQIRLWPTMPRLLHCSLGPMKSTLRDIPQPLRPYSMFHRLA